MYETNLNACQFTNSLGNTAPGYPIQLSQRGTTSVNWIQRLENDPQSQDESLSHISKCTKLSWWSTD